jgi:hypothetical protein
MDNRMHETEATLETDSEQPRRRRTVWIWIIFAYSLCYLLAAIGSLPMILTDPPITTLVLVGLLSAGILFAAAFALLFLRSVAVPFFILGLLVDIVQSFYISRDPSYWASIEATWKSQASLGRLVVWSMIVFALIVEIAMILYSLALRRRGVLR